MSELIKENTTKLLTLTSRCKKNITESVKKVCMFAEVYIHVFQANFHESHI